MDIPALHTLTNGIIIGICLSISFGLVCFKQMAHAINPKYRRACHFFIAASLIIAAGHLAELLVDGFGGRWTYSQYWCWCLLLRRR